MERGVWRKWVGPFGSVLTGAGLLAGHVQPDLAVIAATGAGQLMENTVDRPREAIVHDENRDRRAQAYEDFGSAIALLWSAANMLLTFRPPLQGYLHGLASLVRAQRRLEEQHAAAIAALHSVLLYGSSETQEAALEVFRAVGRCFTEASQAGKQGSEAVKRRVCELSGELGDAVVAWRWSAQADLGSPS